MFTSRAIWVILFRGPPYQATAALDRTVFVNVPTPRYASGPVIPPTLSSEHGTLGAMTKYEERGAPSGPLFVPGATEAQAREIQAAALLPEGSMVLRLDAKHLYEQHGLVTVIEVPSGATLLRLIRDDSGRLAFTHVSPGTGTRVATLPLPPFAEGPPFLLTMTWSESSTDLYAGFVGGEPAHASGTQSTARAHVSGEEVYQVGDAGLEVMGYHVFANGELVLRESGLDAWNSTRRAIDIHMKGIADDGYIGEVISANLALVMIATGVETYCGRRFLELPSEGRTPDVQAFARAMVPEKYFVAEKFNSLADVLESRHIDFGNFDTSKKAFRAAYGVRFAHDLGLTADTLAAVKRTLTFRQRIAHVSPLIGFLNQPSVPPEAPVFAGRALVRQMLEATNAFIESLHAATLRLR